MEESQAEQELQHLLAKLHLKPHLKLCITNFIDNLINDVDIGAEEYLLHITAVEAKQANNRKRDEMISEVRAYESACLSYVNVHSEELCRRLTGLSTRFKHAMAGLARIDNRLQLQRAASLARFDLKQELTKLRNEIFLNKLVFFIPNDLDRAGIIYFGSLVFLADNYTFNNHGNLDLIRKIIKNNDMNLNLLLSTSSSPNDERVLNKKYLKFRKGLEVFDYVRTAIDALNCCVASHIDVHLNYFEKACNLCDKRINSIESDAFIAGGAIKELDLSSNLLRRLDANVFESLKSLEILNLSGNGIHTIDAGAFHGLVNLKDLDLSYNKLSVFRPRTFRHLSTLEVLCLNCNELSAVSSDILNGMACLKELYFCCNKLNRISAGSFERLKHLEILNLSNNKICALDSDAFNGLLSLKELDLTNNKLRALHARQFQRLKCLKFLNLNRNEISEVESDAFDGLASLKTLRFNDNRLNAISRGTFRGLDSLNWLFLDRNKLSLVDRDAFVELNALRYLSLDTGLVEGSQSAPDNENAELYISIYIPTTCLTNTNSKEQ